MKYILFAMVFLCLPGCGSDEANKNHYPLVEHMALDVSGDRVSAASPPFWQVWATDHSQLDLTGRRANCSTCHEQSFCSECHGAAEVYTMEKFAKSLVREHWGRFHLVHPISDQSHLNLCLDCHQSGTCEGCHQSFDAYGSSFKRWGFAHAEDARQNLSSCQVCHPDGKVCLKCHGSAQSGLLGVNPHPVTWNDLKSTVDSSACANCH